MQTTVIDLLRHGRTTADNILRGHVDTPLSAEGYAQMQQSLASLQSAPPWQKVICSPLQRCANFAHDIAASINCTAQTNHGFIEMDFGDWDGRCMTELSAEYPELYSKVWASPGEHDIPGAETFQQFSQRVHSAWRQLIDDSRGQHILLVTHNGVIRALLGQLLQAPLSALARIDVPYACLSRITVYHDDGHADWPQLTFHRPYA